MDECVLAPANNYNYYGVHDHPEVRVLIRPRVVFRYRIFSRNDDADRWRGKISRVSWRAFTAPSCNHGFRRVHHHNGGRGCLRRGRRRGRRGRGVWPPAAPAPHAGRAIGRAAREGQVLHFPVSGYFGHLVRVRLPVSDPVRRRAGHSHHFSRFRVRAGHLCRDRTRLHRRTAQLFVGFVPRRMHHGAHQMLSGEFRL